MHMNRAQGTLLLAGYMTYVVMGSFVFEILENDNHKYVKEDIFRRKEEFLLNYKNCGPEEVELFIVKLIKATEMGIDPVGTQPHDKQGSWNFANSFFFVGTMLSTVGYGYLCPRTKGGQIFCVIFALFGIPFYLICLNYIGSLVSGTFKSCADAVYGKKKNKKSARYIFVFVVLGIIMFLILPPFLYQWQEGWQYHEAIYYTFITLSTIGFGDYLIGRNRDRNYFLGYRMVASIWFIVGLAWITVLFELVTSLLAPVDQTATSQNVSRGQK
ncbi:potassium channel subfamily K member 16-like [Zootoca vivipara]|uniref:potassium channel subfamily K member 16-like n=1 Tax=Zootoca vivipara TaxID=8524 RepID=UPI00293BE8EB|nr:potassium channel subfamily K member 16-like [Zootoca vivipara]